MGLTEAWDLGEEGKGSGLESWQLRILGDESSNRCMLRDIQECLCDSLGTVDGARGTHQKGALIYKYWLFNNKYWI